MLFGLACEGVTDHITLENILCGYFNNPDLDQSITQLQPPFDETDQKQGDGGWPNLLKYLASTRFQEDTLNSTFIVLQIDSDIADKLGIAVLDANGNTLTVAALINCVKDKLIAAINQGADGFYERHAANILFAICVHSLECWLVAHHAQQSAIHNCFDVLKAAVDHNQIRVTKKPKNYRLLSVAFLTRSTIDTVAQKDASFAIFIQALATIENQITP